ncbi:MAG: type III polyketide synthase [Planctomycetes bacterium]|nr:type III polyketide synthase [Planctomycetota bacterium]
MANAWITHVGHALPGPAVPQQTFSAWMEPRLAPGTSLARWRKFTERVGVSFRHSVLDVFGAEGNAFWPIAGKPGPGTGERSRMFDQRALPLAVSAVQAARIGDLSRVTHLVVVPCTGAVAPGLDIQLVSALELPRTVRRTMIAFMGCYAAIPALRVARDICRADSSAQVLVVCCELSSLHLQAGPHDDALLAACLFGDGASAALVRGGEAPDGPDSVRVRIIGDASALIPDTGAHMTWHAGDHGFVLGLSPAITGSLSADLAPLCAEMLGKDVPPASARWIIHPGGPRIVDVAAKALGLDEQALVCSRRALSDGGNRSSGTVLAILADELATPWSGAMGMFAFGPGLTAEALLLERL